MNRTFGTARCDPCLCRREFVAQPLCLSMGAKNSEPGCADNDADARGAADPLPADYQALGARAKRELLWSNVTRSAYTDDALPTTDPGLMATLPLIWPPYLKKAFLNG